MKAMFMLQVLFVISCASMGCAGQVRLFDVSVEPGSAGDIIVRFKTDKDLCSYDIQGAAIFIPAQWNVDGLQGRLRFANEHCSTMSLWGDDQGVIADESADTQSDRYAYLVAVDQPSRI